MLFCYMVCALFCLFEALASLNLQLFLLFLFWTFFSYTFKTHKLNKWNSIGGSIGPYSRLLIIFVCVLKFFCLVVF